jgi:putative sporulation protein YyaC
MVGTLLEEKLVALKHNVKIIGTLQNPVVSSNYKSRITEIRKGAFIILVDAVIGSSMPCIDVVQGGFKPGAAMNGKLQSVGDIGIKCFMGLNLHELIGRDVDLLYSMSRDIAVALADVLTTDAVKTD